MKKTYIFCKLCESSKTCKAPSKGRWSSTIKEKIKRCNKYEEKTMKKKTISRQTDKLIELIAKEELGIVTLKVRKSDRLDFHECSVTSIKKALQRAYDIGCTDGFADAEYEAR